MRGEFPRYVSSAEQQWRAATAREKMRASGTTAHPVVLREGKIARTFWGKAWCQHLESFSDFANRLPRGRSYVRNGAVVHLDIRPGEVLAKVQGSRLYSVSIRIAPLAEAPWKSICARCTGQIESVLDLLQGQLSDSVMKVVTDRQEGLFPRPREIALRCSCPDWAEMCKHVAAVLYGVGARLDEEPGLLFLLRGVDHQELITSSAAAAVTRAVTRGATGGSRRIPESELAGIFGAEFAGEAAPPAPPAKGLRGKRSKKTAAGRKPTKKAGPARRPRKARGRPKKGRP